MEANEDQKTQAFLEMWERGKQEAAKRLMNPETAIFPEFDPGMVSHDECDDGEFIFDTYVDAQNARGRLVRARVRIKFSEADRSYLGASFQKPKVVRRWLGAKIEFEWGPFERYES